MANAPGGGYVGVLARMRGKAAPADEDSIADAIFRISQSPDGERFLNWVYHNTLGFNLPDDAPDGALRADAARKKFASTIFNLVERGRTKWQSKKTSSQA